MPRNEKRAGNKLIKNGKYFIPPQSCSDNFKVLFARLAAEGAGCPVDRHGFADGPWTPEKLANAISSIDGNYNGIELRTVQVWFQDNDNGISDDNIRWLARIFGCNDPEKTAKWQAELKAAKERLSNERRKKRKLAVTTNAPGRTPGAKPSWLLWRSGISERSESMFLGAGPFNMIVLMWGFTAVMFFLSYIVGVHDVSYSPKSGLEKQVGLLWSPNWYLDKLVWLPLVVIVVSNVVTFWTESGRASLVSEQSGLDEGSGWKNRMAGYSISFWAIFIVSLFITFLLQWYGSYLRPLLQNDVGKRVVDWLLIAIEKPDVMTISESILISMFAVLIAGVGYWYCFAGLMLLYVVATDFKAVCGTSAPYYRGRDIREALEVAYSIIRGVYCCVVFTILASTGIRLVAVYLMTDAENIMRWLLNDAFNLFGARNEEWTWFDKTPSASITSFFVMFIPCFVFFHCLYQIHCALRRLIIANLNRPQEASFSPQVRLAKLQSVWFIWSGIIILLVANFWLIGRFSGFSLLLFGSLGIAIYSVVATNRNSQGETIG